MKEEKNLLNFKNRILLCLVAGFIALMALGVRVYASTLFTATHEDVPLYFGKGNLSFYCNTNDYGYERIEIVFDDPVNAYTLFYKNSLGNCLVTYCPNDTSSKPSFIVYYKNGSIIETLLDGTGTSGYSNISLAYVTELSSSVVYENYGHDADSYRALFRRFVDEGYAADFKPEVEIVERENFSLTGFECDNTINATWTGVSQCPIVDKTNVEVLIQPSYMYIIDAGTELVQWEEPGDITVDYNDMSFYKPYEEFMEGCPYEDSCFLTLSFTPQVMIEGKLYKGSTIRVKFDEAGNSSGVDIPTSGLPLTYYDFYLKDFTYLEDISGADDFDGWIDRRLKFLWNGPSFGDSIDYITSDVKIEIYTASTGNASDWDWFTYEPSYHVGIDRDYVQFDLLALDKELRESRRTIITKEGAIFSGVYFRITPYFKTSEAYCYGRSIYVQLSGNGTVLSCRQSIGDAFSEDNPGFENVVENREDNSLMGDLLDDVFSSSEDGFDVEGLTFNFFSLLQGLISSLGQFPSLFATVFSFLPDYFISMLVVGLSGIILLRILGR